VWRNVLACHFCPFVASDCKDTARLQSCVFKEVRGLTHAACSFLLAGIDFKIRTIELDEKKIKLQIWYVCAAPGR
jgi:hypothetical protein